VKTNTPQTRFSLWRSDRLFNIDFAGYDLSNHSFARHFHDHYVIELVTSGADRFYCNGKNYTAEKEQLVLINPGEVHTGSTIAGTPLQYYSLYPGKDALQQIAASLHLSLPRDFNFQQTLVQRSGLTGKFLSFFQLFHDDAVVSLQQEELFLECMHALLKSTLTPYSSSPPIDQKDKRVDRLIDFMHAHFKEEISLQQIAEQVALNPFHVVRFFKRSVGISPYEYLLIIRTEYAKQLLRQGYKVSDAALEAGFYDASHFNRLLRKFAGTSPKSFLLSKGQYCTNFTG
jgi:AraC-like DNA-binding protein